MRLKPAIAAFLLIFVAGAALSAPYYTRVHSFAPLTKVRSQQINNEFNAIQTSFALLPANATGGFSGTVVVGTATGTTHALTYGQLQTLDTDIDAVSTYTINNLITPVSGGDAANKTYVDATVAAGMPPSALAITDLGIGTATANQVVTINGAGTAVVGLDQSSIDAGTLDSLNSTQFLRSDQSGTLTGDLTATGDVVLETNNVSTLRAKDTVSVAQSLIRLDQYDNIAIGHSSGVDYLLLDTLLDQKFRVASTEAFRITGTGTKTTGDHEVTGNVVVAGTVDGRDVATDGTKLDGIESGATADQTKADIDALNVDADTLDSLNGSQFMRTDLSQTITATHTISGGVPGFYLHETDAAADARYWYPLVNSEQLAIQIRDDAKVYQDTIFQIDRSGNISNVNDANLTGDLILGTNNTSAIKSKDTGGSNVDILRLDSGDNLYIGHPTGVDAMYINSLQDQVYKRSGAEKFRVETAGTKTTGDHTIDTGDGVTSAVANIRFDSTFYDHVDVSSRRTADITVGFSTNAWGTEYLAIGVGGATDSGNLTTERFRLDAAGTKTTGSHEITSDLTLSTNNSSITIDDSVGVATNMLTFNGSDRMLLGDSTKVDAIEFDVSSGAAADGIRFSKNGSLGVHIGANAGDTTFGGQTGIATNENTNEGVHIRGVSGQINTASDATTSSNLYLSKIGAIDGDYVAFNRNAVEVGSIDYASGVIRYNTTSDYRLKDNIQLLDNGLVLVNQLQPKTFNYLTHPDDTVFGFLAHEVQEVVPEAVTGEKDGEKMQQLDASKLIPILTKAIQELSARVQYLESQTIN